MGSRDKARPSPSVRGVILEAAGREPEFDGNTGRWLHYREHLNAALSACMFQLGVDHPDWRLECLGEDMGGPIYVIHTNDKKP